MRCQPLRRALCRNRKKTTITELNQGLKLGLILMLIWCFMRQVLANCSASISELKKNPTALLNEADGSAIAILNHNKPAAYLVPAETYEYLIDMLDDYELSQIVDSRRADLSQAVEVNIDDL